jgi:hypothetical protein
LIGKHKYLLKRDLKFIFGLQSKFFDKYLIMKNLKFKYLKFN